ncbi:MAG TPA: hypothetical protein VH916_09025 [Dehalococcoidia bacterium]
MAIGRAYAQDQTPQVTVTLDRTHVTVGDPINLTVVIRHAPGVTIATTSIDDQLGDLEPLSSEPPQERQVNGAMELRLQYRVAAYHTGSVALPQLTFAYALPDGTSGQVQSKGPEAITVQSVLPPGATPADIQGLKPQESLPVPASQQLIWLAGIAGIVAAVVLIAAGGAWLWRRRGRPAAVPAPSQAAIARAELDRIMALGLVQKGELAEHYRLIAVCIRRYLTERFGFPAVALTSGELSGRMEGQGVERWPARLVSGLLSECDAVAYARYVPAPARIEADNAMAYEIIDATEGLTPEPQPAKAV